MNKRARCSHPGLDVARRLRLAGEAQDATIWLHLDRVARTFRYIKQPALGR